MTAISVMGDSVTFQRNKLFSRPRREQAPNCCWPKTKTELTQSLNCLHWGGCLGSSSALETGFLPLPFRCQSIDKRKLCISEGV